MMRLLVTGRTGQVARALQALATPELEVIALGRPQLDLAQPDTLARALDAILPDAVASVAAYTAVDQAESEPEAARLINAAGPTLLAQACAARGLPIVHLSTDYVFDGRKAAPYHEEDRLAPASVYGTTKAQGEAGVAGAGGRFAILRTAWVFDATGRNFVRTMLRLAKSRPSIQVVDDQFGSPTYAPFIANGVIAVARALLAENSASRAGLYHMTSAGACTWREFAEAIFAGSAARAGPWARVEPITTAQYPTPAHRPANSVLDCSKFAHAFGFVLPDWRAGLDACLDTISAEGWNVG